MAALGIGFGLILLVIGGTELALSWATIAPFTFAEFLFIACWVYCSVGHAVVCIVVVVVLALQRRQVGRWLLALCLALASVGSYAMIRAHESPLRALDKADTLVLAISQYARRHGQPPPLLEDLRSEGYSSVFQRQTRSTSYIKYVRDGSEPGWSLSIAGGFMTKYWSFRYSPPDALDSQDEREVRIRNWIGVME